MRSYLPLSVLTLLFLTALLTTTFSDAGPDSLVVDPVSNGLGKDDLPVGWDLKQWFGGGHDIQIE